MPGSPSSRLGVLVLICVSVFPAVRSWSGPMFQSSFQSYPTSGSFESWEVEAWGTAVTGDLNRDGKPDLAVANGGDLSVFLGPGDGTFPVRIDVPIYGKAAGVAVGDIDRDYEPDLVCTHSDSASLAVLLGDGSGGFTSTAAIPAPARMAAVVITDLNGDRKPDLVATCTSLDSIAVWLGNGNGTFQSAPGAAAGIRPMSLASGDLDHDGSPDVVVANLGSPGTPVSSVSVLLGNGQGGFHMQTHIETPAGSRGVAVADANDDGDLDLISVHDRNADFVDPLPGIVTVRLGRGDGTFGEGESNWTGSMPRSVAVGDWNADGRPDIAVACLHSGAVSMLLGNGDGRFSHASIAPVSAYPSSVATEDFDRDGNLDLVLASPPLRSVCVALGNGDLSFGDLDRLPTSQSPDETAIGDLDGDGLLDLVSVHSDFFVDPDSLSVRLGLGGRDFSAEKTFPCGFSPTSITLADVDNDSRLDALVSLYGYTAEAPDSGTIGVLLGLGNGGFAPLEQYTAGFQPYGVAVADFDHDGNLDIATANAGSSTVSVLLGLGDGSFESQLIYVVGRNPRWIATADVNGDTHPDLLTVTVSTLHVLLGQGDGTFELQSQPVPANAAMVTTGDWNLDGNTDLAIPHGIPDIVSTWLGYGDGFFQKGEEIITPGSAWVLRAGDVNVDGREDLIGASFPAGSILLCLGRTDGTFEVEPGVGAGLGPYSLAVGDLDTDGWPDLVVPHLRETSVGILWNLGGLPTPPAPGRHSLFQNAPNPFNPETVIRYELATAGRVQIHVYDVHGRLVRTLMDAESPAGLYSVRWSGELREGRRAPSGVYLYRITYPDGTAATKKMTIVR